MDSLSTSEIDSPRNQGMDSMLHKVLHHGDWQLVVQGNKWKNFVPVKLEISFLVFQESVLLRLICPVA